MNIAKFNQIKEKFDIKDDDLYSYTIEKDGVLKLLKINEYETLAEQGLQDIYDNEPDGLWEQCLAS